MDRKEKLFRVPSLSFLIMITMIAGIIMAVTLLSATSYIETRNNLEKNRESFALNAEQHLTDSIILVANGLRLFELTYDGELRKAFIPFVAAYNKTPDDPLDIDLNRIKRELPPAISSRTDLYLINEDGVVINATYIPDIGLDFKQWPDVYEDITRIRSGNVFRSDRAVIGFNPERDTRKFAYYPAPDHRYLLELSITVDEYTQERSKFSFLSVADSISEKYPDIRTVTLYDTMFRLLTKNESLISFADNETREIIRNVYSGHEPVIVNNQLNNTQQRFIFIDAGGNETVSDNMLDIVACLDYNMSAYEGEQRSTLYYHLMIAVASALSGILFVFLLARHFSGPVNRIIEDIDIIAQGDLDHPVHHTGSPEFIRLEASINLLVNSLKLLINSLREKEENLITSEQRYRSMIEHQSDLILRLDTSGVILYVNEVFCRFFNIDYPVGKTFFDLVSDENKPEISRLTGQLSDPDRVNDIEYRTILDNNQEKWIQWSKTAIYNPENRIIEYLAVGRDISDRKTAENALRESEEKNRTLISSLPDYVIVHQDEKIVYANESITQELGFIPEKFVGSSIFDYVLDADIPLINTNIRRRVAGEKIEDYEIHIRSGKGDLKTVIVRASPISYNNKPAIITVLTDITGRKNAEQQIREGEKKYRSLIEQLNEGIWIFDENAITTFTNRRMQDLLKYEKEELLGKSYFSCISPDKISYVMEKMMYRKSGESDRYPMTFITKEGMRIFTEVSATPMFDQDGNYSGTLALISDITQRKQGEQKIEEYTRELEQKNRELEGLRDQLFIVNENLDRFVHKRTEQVMNLLRQKDEFIMQLGHDLRTPLTPIIGLLPDLINEERDDFSRHALEIIRQNIRIIYDIASKSLKLAKMNSFAITPEIEPIAVRMTIMDIIKAHERDLQISGIVTSIMIEDNLVIGFDKILFQELIGNIISNAIKYIQRSDGKMTFKTEREGKNVVIRIKDNGIGLRADEIEKIFEVFYKSDRSRHDKSSTGLGLSICRKIVENHGGVIRAESSGPGEGTSFIIMLPIWNEKE